MYVFLFLNRLNNYSITSHGFSGLYWSQGLATLNCGGSSSFTPPSSRAFKNNATFPSGCVDTISDRISFKPHCKHRSASTLPKLINADVSFVSYNCFFNAHSVVDADNTSPFLKWIIEAVTYFCVTVNCNLKQTIFDHNLSNYLFIYLCQKHFPGLSTWYPSGLYPIRIRSKFLGLRLTNVGDISVLELNNRFSTTLCVLGRNLIFRNIFCWKIL